jgi:hypothetical protein
MSYVSNGTIVVTDANDASETRFSRSQVRKSLERRSGRVFVTMARLAFLYSHPQPQCSALTFVAQGKDVVVGVANDFRLTFVQQEGELRVSRIDYVFEEGD